MTVIALLVFWISGALILYAYAGFPLIIALRGALFPMRHKTADITPSVSLIVAAYNESAVIADKMRNIADLDYPPDQFEAIVASDGSTDGTAEIALAAAGDRVQVLELPRQGKAAALNTAIGLAQGDILVMSDASTIYRPDAIRNLVRHFADERVGGVAGNQRYVKRRQGGNNAGEAAYWDFDRQLKLWESQAGNTISATGSIYAIRRALFQGVPAGMTDDFAVSTSVIVQGYRLIFDPDAVAFEAVAPNQKREFTRKVRVMTRGLTGVLYRRELVNPFRYGFYAVQLFTHKLLRRLLFIPMILILVSNVLLISFSRFYALTLAAQAVFYSAALVGWWLMQRGIRLPKPLSVVTYVCMVYAAAAVATWNVVRGRRIVRWTTQGTPG